MPYLKLRTLTRIHERAKGLSWWVEMVAGHQLTHIEYAL